MANIKSAKKRALQSNRNVVSTTPASFSFHDPYLPEEVIAAIASGDKAAATAAFAVAQPIMDHYGDQGLDPQNKAARHKSRLSAPESKPYLISIR